MTLAVNSVHVIDRRALSERMFARKHAQNVTWNHVAHQTGITLDGLLRIVHRERSPHGDTLVSILQWLGTPDTAPYTARRDGTPASEVSSPARTGTPRARRIRTATRTPVHTGTSASRVDAMTRQIMDAFHAVRADTLSPAPDVV